MVVFLTLSILFTNVSFSIYRKYTLGKLIPNVKDFSKDDYLNFNEIEKKYATFHYKQDECSFGG